MKKDNSLNQRFDAAIKNVKEAALELNTLMIYEKGQVLKHVFEDEEKIGVIRSISKQVTCLCFGIAIEKGLFKDGLNEKVYPYLIKTQNITIEKNVAYIKEWTIKTLLTLTIGIEEAMLNSKHLLTIEGQNYGDVVLNADIKHKAGEYFLYSNAPMYLASIVFQNALNISLLDFANEHIFSKMGFTVKKWKQSPQGYCMGCTGIEMQAEELLDLGILMLNKGVFNGQRIVSSNWIDEMFKIQVLTPLMYDETRVLPKYAYGLNTWITKDHIYYCDGTDGQYLIVVPKQERVIVTIGNQKNMKPITVALADLIKEGIN